MELAFFWIVFSVAVAIFAHRRGRDWLRWFLLSLVITPLLAFILVAVSADLTKEGEKALRMLCPYCSEPVLKTARLCPQCRSDLAAQPGPTAPSSSISVRQFHTTPTSTAAQSSPPPPATTPPTSAGAFLPNSTTTSPFAKAPAAPPRQTQVRGAPVMTRPAPPSTLSRALGRLFAEYRLVAIGLGALMLVVVMGVLFNLLNVTRTEQSRGPSLADVTPGATLAEKMKNLPDDSRNGMLTYALQEEGCVVVQNFYQGMDAGGAASFSVRCRNGKTFSVGVSPDGSTRVLECSVMAAYGAPCWTTFHDSGR